MAETSGPFDATDLTEADWELMIDQIVDGALSGLAASASGSVVRGVDFTAGTALVRGHWYRNSATLTKASTANGASSARIDRAVYRLDRTANTVTIEVLTGTPGSSTPPALTNTSTVTERPFKRWTVGPAATVISDLTDESQALRRGNRSCTSTNRPVDPAASDAAYETDTGRWIGWTGSAWVVLAEDTGWTNLSMNGANGAFWVNTASRVRKRNGVVHLHFAVKRWPDSALGVDDDSVPINLGAAYRPTADTIGYAYHGDSSVALQVEADGDVRLIPLGTGIPANRTVKGSATWLTD